MFFTPFFLLFFFFLCQLEFLNERGDRLPGVVAQLFAEVVDPVCLFRVREATAFEGGVDLSVECLPVGDEDEFWVGHSAAELEAEKKHGERFAGTLSVPDDAAGGLLLVAVLDAFEGFLDGTVLLIAGDQLGRPVLVAVEHGEMSELVEQAVWIEQRIQHPILRREVAIEIEAVDEVLVVQRVGVLPALVLARWGAVGAHYRALVPCRYRKLVIAEQLLGPFAPTATFVLIARELVGGFRSWFGNRRGLALDNAQRQAVDEQHDVRDYRLAWPLDRELVQGEEIVVFRIVEVDVVDRLVFLPMAAVLFDGGVANQQFVDRLVFGHRVRPGDMPDLADGLLKVSVG